MSGYSVSSESQPEVRPSGNNPLAESDVYRWTSSSTVSVAALLDEEQGVLGRQFRGQVRRAQEGSDEAAIEGKSSRLM